MNDQLTIPRMSRLEATSPKRLMTDAVAWIDANLYAWVWIVRQARLDADLLGRVRVKRYIEEVRYSPDVVRVTNSPVKVANALSAPLGRILAAWYPSLASSIPLTHSKLDGMIVPPCPDWARNL
jgi:hypothetical protein